MMSKRNRPGPPKGKSSMLVEEKKQNQLLSSIDERLRNTQHTMNSVVPDVPNLRLKRNKVYTTTENYQVTVIGSTTGEVDTSVYHTFAQTPNYLNFQAVFDSYRIVHVRAVLIPEVAQTTGGATIAPIYTAIDYDDASSTNLASLLQYDTLQASSANTLIERNYRPKAALAAYSGAFTSYGYDQGNWFAVSSPSVQYYGLKIAIPASATFPPTWIISFTYTIQFKNLR